MGVLKANISKEELKMIRSIREAMAMFFLAVGLSFAGVQDSAIDGRWQGASMTANGPAKVAYNLRVKGEVLTGTGETPAGSQMVTEGRVKGNQISFKTEINGHVIEHQGTISGDTMLLKNFGPGGEFDLKLKHVSSEQKSAPQ
jgi:hypothetical protein